MAVTFKWLSLLILLLTLSCGEDEVNIPMIPLVNNIELLNSKYDLYLSLQTDSMRDDCDGLLFRSLMSIGGNSHINIKDHFDEETGMWYRSPDNSCSNTSTISRDMMMGLIWWMWINKDLDAAKQLRSYAFNHGLVMGEGDSRVIMSPALYSTLSLVIDRLENRYTESYMPMVWDKGLAGYRSHLTVLHILLRADLLGMVSENELDVLATYANREPQNALFSYAYAKYTTGDYTQAISDLMNPQWFPADRLPTCKDREDKWILEREYSTTKSWIPGGCELTHTGGDFLFVAKLILMEYGK